MLLRTRWLVLLVAIGCGPPAPATTVDFEPGPPPTTAAHADLPPATGVPPPPPTTAAPLADEAHRCVTADDCVLVTGTCGGITAVNRAHAREEQDRFDAIASVGECAAMSPQDPVDPSCDEGACTTRVAVEADARACQTNRDCEAIQMTCNWVVASRTAPGFVRLQALASGLHGGATSDCVVPPAPEAECRYHYCSRASDLVPAVHH